MDRSFRATRAVQAKLSLIVNVFLKLSTDMRDSIDSEK